MYMACLLQKLDFAHFTGLSCVNGPQQVDEINVARSIRLLMGFLTIPQIVSIALNLATNYLCVTGDI